MHYRRLACLLLGGWLGASMFMTMVATQNFRSVDRLLANPPAPAGRQIEALGGHEAARTLLRYQVSEQNRWYFETWESIQIGLSIAVFLIVLFATTQDKIGVLLALLMIVAVAVQRFLLTPNIVSLGRLIDYVPQDAPSAERTRFWMYHTAYSTIELLKWGMGLLLAGKLIVRRSHSRHFRDEVDMIDEPDDSHVNR